MRTNSFHSRAILALAASLLLLVSAATAQAGNKPGPFPVKVDRDNYPAPEYRYPNAEIGLTAADSKPDFPPPRQLRKARPTFCWCWSTT